MNFTAKVSIYITTKNRPELLSRAINSVLEQTYSNIEILVVDDGSSPLCHKENLKIIELLPESVRYFYNEHSKGACYARNMAISEASGEYITGLDDDDTFTNNRIETFINSWNDNLSFICSNHFNIYSDRKVRHYSKGGVYQLNQLLVNNEAGNQIFTKTDRLRNIGGFDVSVKKLQDWDTWIRLCATYGNFKRLNTTTYNMHHDHSFNRVSNNETYLNALESLIKRNSELYQGKELISIKLLIMSQKGKMNFPLCWDSVLARVPPSYILKQIIKVLIK